MNDLKRKIDTYQSLHCTVTASCDNDDESNSLCDDDSSLKIKASFDADLILETYDDQRKMWLKNALDQFCQRVCTPKTKVKKEKKQQ